jgi:chemotaxis signal transduction protein
VSPGEQRPWGSILVFELGARTSQNTPRRAAGAAAAPAAGEPGGDAYGMDIDQLRQVVEPTTVAPVPLAPAVVLGIMSFHGRIVTVVDPAPILGLRVPWAAGPESRVLLLRRQRVSAGNVGLYVSRVQNIVPPDELEATEVAPGPCVRSVLRHGSRLINIVRAESLLDGLARRFGSGRLPRQGVTE